MGLDYLTGTWDWTAGLEYGSGILSLIAGLDSPLEHGTGMWDWNVGLDYLTGTWDWTAGLEYGSGILSLIAGLDSMGLVYYPPKYACHARQRPIANVVLSCSSSSPCSQTNSPSSTLRLELYPRNTLVTACHAYQRPIALLVSQKIH